VKRKRHINEFVKTAFTSQGGRAAGAGVTYDDYSEESGAGSKIRYSNSRHTPLHTPEELERLMNPPVTIIQAAKTKRRTSYE